MSITQLDLPTLMSALCIKGGTKFDTYHIIYRVDP